MAIQISKAFKDISLSFVRNPITNDILILRNEDAIKKSVINLVRTAIGERFYNPLLGSSIETSLFELNTIEISETISDNIKELIRNFEPRVRVTDVTVDADNDSNELSVEIVYDIIGIPIPPQTVNFILQPTRS